MRSLVPLKLVLCVAVLLLPLAGIAQAQSPGGGGGASGGGPGGNPGGGQGGGSSGPGAGASAPGRDAAGERTPSGPDSSAPATSPSPSPSADIGRYVRGPEGALEAVQANEALPLDQIVTAARHLTEGEIIDARLELVGKMLEYELKVLEANGDVRRYSFDARTGQLMGVR